MHQIRNAVTFSALLLILPAGYPAQQSDLFQTSLHTAQAGQRTGPQPPCGVEPIPPYPGLDAQAVTKSWSKSELGRDWNPPACTGWTDVGFTTLVTMTARFPNASKTDALLRHIGAISELAGMQYWSTTHKRWQTLVVDAYALTDSL